MCAFLFLFVFVFHFAFFILWAWVGLYIFTPYTILFIPSKILCFISMIINYAGLVTTRGQCYTISQSSGRFFVSLFSFVIKLFKAQIGGTKIW